MFKKVDDGHTKAIKKLIELVDRAQGELELAEKRLRDYRDKFNV